MRKISILLLLFVFSACSDNLEELNEDTKNATSADADTFFNLAVKNTSDLLNGITYGSGGNPYNITRLYVQQISSVTYNEGTTYYSNFNWENVYTDVLINLKQSTEVLENSEVDPLLGEDAEAILANRKAVVEIMSVFAWRGLVESFGDLPYTEALDVDVVNPVYEDAQTVYIDLINRLDAAISKIDPSLSGFNNDIMYNGDMSKWLKFANSMKLQMGMRIIDVQPQLGEKLVIEALPGVFTSNADNATVEHLSSPPNTNELWTDLAVGNRRDFVGAEPFVSLMLELDDPRVEVFFDPNADGEFRGSPPGEVVTYADYSPFGELFYQPETAVIFLDYVSVEFFLAEAAERGIGSVSDPENHYNNAIKASFDWYNVEGAEDYLAQSKVNYSTAAGDWKQKIGEQKWIALFNQGLEAWTEWRRLDYPELSAPEGSFIDTVPVRMTYPIDEQNLNQANYENAAMSIGGDLMTTKLWWDVN